MHQIVRVEFNRFKAFRRFTINLKHFNILVGPNNAGKSTIITAFRILSAAMRRANSRNPSLVQGPNGSVRGYEVDLESISVAAENIFYNYEDDVPASVVFKISNNNELMLYFPEQGVCRLIPTTQGRPIQNTTAFKNNFKCPIGFVPILGPVEHHEPLYEKEAARLALFSYTAARNFRNIWHHYPDEFDQFRSMLTETWPGMDILPPEIDLSHIKPRLNMYCPEKRMPRELFWSGFGFQVWCQMLTHIIQSKNYSIFLIDEPDIYLHADLQRQLLNILRNLGPDILIATHSTEIITEAETNDIILVNKSKSSAKRIKDPVQISEVFSALRSNINPVLTQLAKTRRAVFVEGKDFQIISKFSRKLGQVNVANRRDFAVIPIEGFNPERVRNLKLGMEATLGVPIRSAIILDRDYRSVEECDSIKQECEKFCEYVSIHSCKEIENFLLIPTAIDRACNLRVQERVARTGIPIQYVPIMDQVLTEFCADRKNYVMSRTLSERRQFERGRASSRHAAEIDELALNEFEKAWSDPATKLSLIPGKEALSYINTYSQEKFGVTLTVGAIIDAIRVEEISKEMSDLVKGVEYLSALVLPD